MPSIRYQILNVFAETTFGGNPLAVIEDGSGLSTEEMQLVARQLNLSETTFLLPSSTDAAQVRIFTPSYEMAFAGHPTLGSAEVVSQLTAKSQRFSLQMKAGSIPVWKQDGAWMLSANAPTSRPMEATRSELASMLSLPEDAIVGPVLWLNCGTEQPMIQVGSVDHVHACKPVAALISKFSRNADGQAKVYVFARTAEGFESRYFWMANETSASEDPGTGSACANLGGWWQLTQGGAPLKAIVRQGTAMGRPNVLSLSVDAERITVGGKVIRIGSGEFSW
jgi:PhzF family phenazine biosynthesis protein